MMSTRLSRLISALIVVTVFLSACSGTTGSTTTAPLRVGWSLYPGYYPMAIAVEKGFFKEHGVQVEPVFYSLYNDQTPALASGKLDGAALVLNDALLDRVAKEVKIVMITDNSDGADQLIICTARRSV